jgi:hypothetical protein
MRWEFALKSRYREDGGFTASVDLNYLDVRVRMQWLAERQCSLDCRAPGKESWKNLHEAGYRAILAIDRYVGPVAAVNGVDRSTWWIAVLSAYGASGGPRSCDANALMKAAAADAGRQTSSFRFGSLQGLRYLHPRHGAIRLQTDALPRELIHYRQNAERSAVG